MVFQWSHFVTSHVMLSIATEPYLNWSFGSLFFCTKPQSIQSIWLPQLIRALVVMSFAKVSQRMEMGMIIDFFFNTHLVFLGESCITENLPFKNPGSGLFPQLILPFLWLGPLVLVHLIWLQPLFWVFLGFFLVGKISCWKVLQSFMKCPGFLQWRHRPSLKHFSLSSLASFLSLTASTSIAYGLTFGDCWTWVLVLCVGYGL